MLHELILAKSSDPITPRSTIPTNLSFSVKVDKIGPNEKYSNRSSDHPQGFFLPPDRIDGYKKSGPSQWFRFKNGNFTLMPAFYMSLEIYIAAEIYSAATVFSKAPGTDHLLMVPFDARTINVLSYKYGWRSLSFDHKRRNSSSSFASLESIGEKQTLPAPVPPSWKQLIPAPYRFENTDEFGKPIEPTTSFGGLIGSLPLLIALVAFSAVPEKLETVLRDHIRNGKWLPHTHDTDRQFLYLLCHKI